MTADFFTTSERDDKMATRHRRDRFGSWQLDAARSLLVHEKSRHEIDLLELNRPAQMLNCIFQVSAKEWATDADLGTLAHDITVLTGQIADAIAPTVTSRLAEAVDRVTER